LRIAGERQIVEGLRGEALMTRDRLVMAVVVVWLVLAALAIGWATM